jgi:NADH-quinone oxidoreductase subunit N
MTEFAAIVPMLIVTLSAIAAVLAEAFRRPGERMPMGGLGLIGLFGAAVSSVFLWDRDIIAYGVVRADNFALFINILLALVGVLTILFSADLVEREELPAGEYYALVLFGIAGMMLMAAAIDLLIVFLALEVLSISVYVLTGLRRADVTSAEAAFKYFLLGAFSSAFFLYGVAFTYAFAQTTRLDAIGVAVAAQAMNPSLIMLLGVGLLLVGFAFKISAVPFHMWTPDAYEGAPTIVTGFMSTAVKAAAFAAFARWFLSAFDPLQAEWAPILWWVAAASMVVGTVVGVAQTNVKRMLAYSSIAHAGYLLVGIIAANAEGRAGILYYLLAYAITNVGAFGLIALLGTPRRPHDRLEDFAGLWDARPLLAALMAVFLLSLGGLPPTAGFIAKWYIFTAAVREGYYGLAIIGVLTSVVSVFFYLRIVVMMYMSEPATIQPRPILSAPATAGLVIATIAVFYLGILPTAVIDLAIDSIHTIF